MNPQQEETLAAIRQFIGDEQMFADEAELYLCVDSAMKVVAALSDYRLPWPQMAKTLLLGACGVIYNSVNRNLCCDGTSVYPSVALADKIMEMICEEYGIDKSLQG
jgi:hypothetical protein